MCVCVCVTGALTEYYFSIIQPISLSFSGNILAAVICELFLLLLALICEFNFHCVMPGIMGNVCFITCESSVTLCEPQIDSSYLTCYITLGAVCSAYIYRIEEQNKD